MFSNSDKNSPSDFEEFPVEELSLPATSNAKDTTFLDTKRTRAPQRGRSSHSTHQAEAAGVHGKLAGKSASNELTPRVAKQHKNTSATPQQKDSKFRQRAERNDGEMQTSPGNISRSYEKNSKFRPPAQHVDEESQTSADPSSQSEGRQPALQQARPGAEHIRGPDSISNTTLGTILVGDVDTTVSVENIERSPSVHTMLQAELVSDKTVDAIPVTDDITASYQNTEPNQKMTRQRACIVVAVCLILVAAVSGGITGAVLGLTQPPAPITPAPTNPPSLTPLPTCSMAIEMECFDTENPLTRCEYIEKPSRTCERSSARSQFSRIPTALILRYDGGNCSQYPPVPSLLECTDWSKEPAPSSSVFVSAKDTRSSRTFRSNVAVVLNQEFSIHVDNVLALGATTMLDVASSSSTPPFQSVLIQSDCSAKMTLGDYLGPFELVAIYNDDQGRIRRKSTQITYRSIVHNEGGADITLSSVNWTNNFGVANQSSVSRNITIPSDNSTIVFEETQDIIDLSLPKQYEVVSFVTGLSSDGLSCHSNGSYVFTSGAPTTSPTHSAQPSWVPTGIPSLGVETVTPSGSVSPVSVSPVIAQMTISPVAGPVLAPTAGPVLSPVRAPTANPAPVAGPAPFPTAGPLPAPFADITPLASPVAPPVPAPTAALLPFAGPVAPPVPAPTARPVSADNCKIGLDIECSINDGQSPTSDLSCNNGDFYVPQRAECLDAPFAMDFLFTGENCSVSMEVQGSTSFQCSDFAVSTGNITDSYVVVSDTSNANTVLFQGVVLPGERFRIEDFTGNSITSSSVTVNVYLSSETVPENLFQTVTFDISCSGGNFLLDKYGSIKLVGFASDTQGVVSTIVSATYSVIVSSFSEGTLISLNSYVSIPIASLSYNYTDEVNGYLLGFNETLVVEEAFSIDFAIPFTYSIFASVEFSASRDVACADSAFYNFTTVGI